MTWPGTIAQFTRIVSCCALCALWTSGCGGKTITSGSGGNGGDGGNAAETCPSGKLDTLEQVASVATGRIAALKAATAGACAGIAEGLGQSVVDVSDPASLTLGELEQVCNVAVSAIDTEVQDNGGVVIAYSGGYCGVDLDGQSACESELATGTCEPQPLEERCASTDIIGECTGECAAPCLATDGAECTGHCSGLCTGNCDGTCTPASGGGCLCEGTCNGVCQGRCDANAPGATCAGTCLGACSGAYATSSCTEELTPTSCAIEAGCEEACVAQGWFGATCDPGVVVAAGNPTLQPLLDAHLLALLDAGSVTGPAMVEGMILFTNAINPGLLANGSGCEARITALVEQTADDLDTLTTILEAATTVMAAVP